MPPKKDTAPKPTTDDAKASALILEYLTTQNRPYSATDISANLHNAVTKTRTEKCLKEMLERGVIGGKAAGKQWVFWGLQVPAASATPEELAAYDAEITALRESLPALKAELKQKTTLLSTIRSAPTTDSLRDAVDSLQQQNTEMRQRLKVLKSGQIKPVTQEERVAKEQDLAKWKGAKLRRKRAFQDLEAMLLEAGVMSREELWDKLGLDDDP